MDIVISGNINKDTISDKPFIIHKVLRPGYKLHIGTECNDGRPITESRRYKTAKQLGIPIEKRKSKKPKIITPDYEKKEMLVDKYKPKSTKDIIGHKEQITQITNWLKNWPDSGRGLLISGPPGIGKTTTAHIISKELGYKVTEYNASDSRSVSVLRGLMALGIKRLVKEVIVLDEVDGLSERGGVGEIAAIIKKTGVPIICITNDKPPKLRPIINACLDVRFNRPVKSTIANTILAIAKAEEIEITKADLEGLCERNGNDIRSILNNLDFYCGDVAASNNNKDANLRLDLFSATQRLIGNKKQTLDNAAGAGFFGF